MHKAHLAVAAAILAASSLATSPSPAKAAPAPAATAVLFDASHLANMGAGDHVTYSFERKGSDPALLGENFTDTVKVGVTAVEDGGTRAVSVDIFTGARARPEQKISGMTGNPVLVLFLDRAVSNFAALAGGQRPYLKNRFKQQLDQSSKVEPVSISYNGQTFEGFRVSVSPFVGDPNALKMRGYDGSSFEVVVCDKIPGHFVATRSLYVTPSADGLRLEETLKLDGVGEIK
ncbi:MAG: hypothetical protein ACK4MF_09590 [Hyphomicrobiaceae bacterium]